MDGHDRDGNSVISEDDDDLYGDEEGEFEHDDQLLETINNLDPETKKKFEAGELSMDDLKGLGILGDAEEYGDEDNLGSDYGDEEGEADQNGDENGSANKKQKTEEED